MKLISKPVHSLIDPVWGRLMKRGANLVLSSVRLSVRTTGFQPVKRGSIPLRNTTLMHR